MDKFLLNTLFVFGICLPGVSMAQVVAAGGRHSIAICSDSTLQSWGYNGYGQLGNGTTLEEHSGSQVNGLTEIVQVAGGLFHSLFLKRDGSVWSCGRNVAGPLGDGSNEDKHEAVQISGLNDILQIAGGGEHSLFVKNDGTVWACGLNTSRQLGDGTTTNRNTPVQVPSLSGITQAAAGAEFSLFLKNDSTVWVCGHNGFGQYGNGTNTSSINPVKIPGLEGIVYVSAGEWHSLFVRSDGTVFSTGRNMYGQLGHGTTTDANTAVQIADLSEIVHAEAGGIHSVFVKADGTVYSCGLNSGGNNDGQLGDGTYVDRHSPVMVISAWGSDKIVWAEATREHSLYLTEKGEIWSSGRNNYGQLGYGEFTSANSSTPVHASSVCSTIAVSVQDILFNRISSVFPNPFSDQTAIVTDRPLNHATLIVCNSFGQVVKQVQHINGQSFILSRDNLPGGFYFVRLIEDETTIAVCKLIIVD